MRHHLRRANGWIIRSAADFPFYIAVFLFGVALGGYIFGWFGDQSGCVRVMEIGIIRYACFRGFSCFVTMLIQICVRCFAWCMEIGRVWPSAVDALVVIVLSNRKHRCLPWITMGWIN